VIENIVGETMKTNNKINLFVILIISSLTLMIVMNTETLFVSAVPPRPRPYYGEVTFTGTVYLNYSDNIISSVKVELLEDGSPKVTCFTNANGEYELEWNVQKFKLYSLRISRSGYKATSKYIIPTSANHEEDRTLFGRAALFLWAPDVANRTIMQELGDQLVYEEDFTDVLYYENETDWEGAIDDLDALEGYYSQVFVYITGHGETTYIDFGDYRSEVAQCGVELSDTYTIASDDLADKLQDLDSQNIYLLVESCLSIGFVTEYAKDAHNQDPVFAMSSTANTASACWYGDNGTNYNEYNETEGRYGGAFTHFFFEGLDLDKNDIQAFNYAYTNARSYALSVIVPLGQLNQTAMIYDEVTITWF